MADIVRKEWSRKCCYTTEQPPTFPWGMHIPMRMPANGWGARTASWAGGPWGAVVPQSPQGRSIPALLLLGLALFFAEADFFPVESGGKFHPSASGKNPRESLSWGEALEHFTVIWNGKVKRFSLSEINSFQGGGDFPFGKQLLVPNKNNKKKKKRHKKETKTVVFPTSSSIPPRSSPPYWVARGRAAASPGASKHSVSEPEHTMGQHSLEQDLWAWGSRGAHESGAISPRGELRTGAARGSVHAHHLARLLQRAVAHRAPA